MNAPMQPDTSTAGIGTHPRVSLRGFGRTLGAASVALALAVSALRPGISAHAGAAPLTHTNAAVGAGVQAESVGARISNLPAVAAAAGSAPVTRRVLGYFPIWGRNAGYTENDIDFSVVTDVAHFSVLPNPDGSVKIPDWGPFPDTALISHTHAAGARIVLVVGTGDSLEVTAAFGTMATNPTSRDRFIGELTGLVASYGYDGVDIDWEFPENAAQRDGLSALVSGLRAALGTEKTISLASPASDYYGQWLDMKALTPNLDWYGAMTYALHAASWSKHAGHNAALYSTAEAGLAHYGGEISVDSSRRYYQSRAVPAAKLLIGLPFWGERFDGATAMNQTLDSDTGGELDYRDIALMINNGWQRQMDQAADVPYLIRGDGEGVISYEDAESITAKCDYAVAQGLGGAMVWHLGKDGRGENQPLLHAAGACR